MAKQELQTAKEALSGFGDKVNPDFVRMPRVARFEEAVLGLLQLYPELRTAAFQAPPLLEEKDFMTELGKRAFCFIRDAEAKDGFHTEMLDAAFTPDEVGRLLGMRIARMQLRDNGRAVFDACVASLKTAVEEEKQKNAPPSLGALDALLKSKRKNV